MARGGGGEVGESTVVVLDNGAAYCKAGLGGELEPSVVVPNCMARPRSAKKWVAGDQISEVADIQGISIRRPMDRGYLINPDTEKEIWDRLFKTLLKIRPSDCGLLLVEPLFNLPSIQKSTDEIVFEEFGFQSLYAGSAPALSHRYQVDCAPESLLAKSNCSLVVDAGFSFTHAAPVFDGFVVNHAAKRMNLGGKALTNYLKELVSYRAWNMMDETYIIEDVKEKLCLCSLDTPADLAVARFDSVASHPVYIDDTLQLWLRALPVPNSLVANMETLALSPATRLMFSVCIYFVLRRVEELALCFPQSVVYSR